MPCSQVIRNSVSIKDLDRAMLKRALAKRNISFTETRGVIYATVKGVRLEVRDTAIQVRRGQEWVADELKQMCSIQSVEESAEATGFTVTWLPQVEGENLKFELEQEIF